MAGRACCRESCILVVRISGRSELRHMAGSAIRRRTCELTVDVALRASNRVMCAGEWEGRLGMIKNSPSP